MSISLLSLTGAVGVCLIGVLDLATIWFFSVVRTMDELLFCDKNLWFSSSFCLPASSFVALSLMPVAFFVTSQSSGS